MQQIVWHGAEEEGLIAEEQGGFRKRRGYRDQVLSLVLLGQTEMIECMEGWSGCTWSVVC